MLPFTIYVLLFGGKYILLPLLDYDLSKGWDHERINIPRMPKAVPCTQKASDNHLNRCHIYKSSSHKGKPSYHQTEPKDIHSQIQGIILGKPFCPSKVNTVRIFFCVHKQAQIAIPTLPRSSDTMSQLIVSVLTQLVAISSTQKIFDVFWCQFRS